MIWYLYISVTQKPPNICFDMIKALSMDKGFPCDDIFDWEYFF